MHKPGGLIVVEGLEGAGKTTAIQTIKATLEDFVPIVRLTREPGGTKLGEILRRLIKEGVESEYVAPCAELLMIYAARVQLLETVIKPALKNGEWIIADRFELSTYAYQGGGRGINQELIASLSSICLQGFRADLIIFLDINPKIGLTRVKNRGNLDKIEQESLEFFGNVAKAYHQQIQDQDNVCIINASLTLAEVQTEIIKKVQSFLFKKI